MCQCFKTLPIWLHWWSKLIFQGDGCLFFFLSFLLCKMTMNSLTDQELFCFKPKVALSLDKNIKLMLPSCVPANSKINMAKCRPECLFNYLVFFFLIIKYCQLEVFGPWQSETFIWHFIDSQWKYVWMFKSTVGSSLPLWT